MLRLKYTPSLSRYDDVEPCANDSVNMSGREMVTMPAISLNHAGQRNLMAVHDNCESVVTVNASFRHATTRPSSRGT